MRIHAIQHVAFEGLGSIQAWASSQGATVHVSQMFAEATLPTLPTLPTLAEFDWLLVMGGPMNIYQDEQYPWLPREKELIKAAIAGGKVVLGICLGAQLIADALGAAVTPNQHREIGWFPLTVRHPLLEGIIPNGTPVLHWHGDTFALPPGAERLAESEACLNQGFIFEGRVVGLQFHLETTPESLSLLLDQCGAELEGGGHYVQTALAMQGDPQRFTTINTMMASLLNSLRAGEQDRKGRVIPLKGVLSKALR